MSCLSFQLLLSGGLLFALFGWYLEHRSVVRYRRAIAEMCLKTANIQMDLDTCRCYVGRLEGQYDEARARLRQYGGG